MVIPTLGGKSRVVTKSPGSLIALGHYARKVGLEILRKHPASRQVLSGDRRGSIQDLIQRCSRHLYPTRPLIVSADLTAATDRIPFGVSQAIWEEILGHVCAPLWLQRVVALLTGP